MEMLNLLFQGNNVGKACAVIFVIGIAITMVVEAFRGKKGDE